VVSRSKDEKLADLFISEKGKAPKGSPTRQPRTDEHNCLGKKKVKWLKRKYTIRYWKNVRKRGNWKEGGGLGKGMSDAPRIPQMAAWRV